MNYRKNKGLHSLCKNSASLRNIHQ